MKGDFLTMSLQNWYEKGLTETAYRERLDKHKDGFNHIFESFSIPGEDSNELDKVKNIRALVIAAEWCGHCMLDIPIFLHIAKEANIETRFLIRDDNEALMKQYETNGKQYIPIIIFIDEDGNEVGKWGPWAPEVNEFTDQLKAHLPERDSEQFEAAFQEFIQKVSTAFTTDKSLWTAVYNDMKKSILAI